MTIEKIYTKEDLERIVEEVLAVEREARKEQAREIERLKDCWQDCRASKEEFANNAISLQNRIAAMKAQPSGVVLPEPMKRGDEGGSGEYGAAMIRGYNACLREVARLNACQVSAGGVDERAAFEAECERLGLALYAGSDSRYAPEIQCAWMLWQARAALTAGRAAVPEGWKLVPERMHLDAEVIESINYHCGYGEEDEGFGSYSHGVLWVGEIEEEDGTKTYGLHLATADYPEEGSTTLVEFAATPSAQQQGEKP